MSTKLDETFGQYPAFSILGADDIADEESHQVAAYLKSVREDAVRDAPVHFVPSSPKDRSQQSCMAPSSETEPTRWCSDVLHRFNQLQCRIKQEKTQLTQSVLIYECPETAAQWRQSIFELDPPGMSVILQFDRAKVFRLVVYITRWLSLSVNEHFSKWIWVLLSLVEKPLDCNESAVMHELGRKAQKLECKSQGGEIARYTIDFVRVLVGHAFGQFDILERLQATPYNNDAESAKKRRLQ